MRGWSYPFVQEARRYTVSSPSAVTVTTSPSTEHDAQGESMP